MTKKLLWIAAALVVAAALAIILWPRSEKIDEAFIAGCKDGLKEHNAKFLGRGVSFARYELLLTGSSGERYAAPYRLPASDKKVPLVLVFVDTTDEASWTEQLNRLARANDVAVIGILCGQPLNASAKSRTTELQRKLRAADCALEYAHRHFAIDTNQTAVVGIGEFAIHAKMLAALRLEKITQLYASDVASEKNSFQRQLVDWADPKVTKIESKLSSSSILLELDKVIGKLSVNAIIEK